MSISSHRRKREGTMTARILKTLALTLVLGGVFAASASAMQITEPSIYSARLSKPSAAPVVPIVSEKVAGLQAVQSTEVFSRAHYRAALLRNNGPNESSAVVASGGNGFDWSNTGIGVGIAFAVLLALTAVTLTARRHGPVAH
jgi:hypothetical protein